MSAVSQFIRLSRPYNGLLPSVAIIAGYSIAGGHTLGKLVVTVAVFVVLHGVVTIWNDYEDEASDKQNDIHRIAAVKSAGNYRRYVWWMISMVLGCMAAGLWLGWQIEALLASYVFVSWFYNSQPAQLSKRPLGSMLCMFLAYGLLPFALGASLGVWRWQVGVLGFSWACTRLSVSLLKDYKDAPGDAKTNKKTFLLVYGGRAVARTSIVFLAAGLAGIVGVAISLNPSWALVVITASALWLISERFKLFQRKDYAGLHTLFKASLRYQLAFDALVTVWLRTQ
jgi:4-hydroxybenzoate polyprenyltransferase